MRNALYIFRKDVRHLWPRAVPLLAITGLLGVIECRPLVPDPISNLLRSFWLLALAFLAASLIQQEALPGDCQYWITRPYSRTDLLAAKASFLAAFAGLPLLMMEAISIAANGGSPWRHIPLLLTATLIFAGGACVFVGALASVTGNLAHFVAGFLPAVGLVILGQVIANSNGNTADWGSLEWIRTAVLGGVVVIAAAVVVFLQYSRRRTLVSRCVLGAAVVVAAAIPFLGSWRDAWAMKRWFSTEKLGDGFEYFAPLTFNASERPLVGFAEARYSPTVGEAGINLPVLVGAFPPGTAVVSERIAARIEAPDGRTWTSGWIQKGGLYRTAVLEDPLLIQRQGAHWEYATVDESFYQSVRDTPVRLHTTVALTLLGNRQTAPLATRTGNEYSSAGSRCGVFPGPFGKLMVFCAWLPPVPARSYVTAVLAANGQTFSSRISAGPPMPLLNGSVWWRDATLFAPPPHIHEMDLETWQALAHFERDLDIPQIHLADYAVHRITDMP